MDNKAKQNKAASTKTLQDAELSIMLGIDESKPSVKVALANAENDHQFLRSLVIERKLQGLTQQDIASQLNMTLEEVSLFERYDNDPTLSAIRRYALILGVEIIHNIAK